MSTQPPYLTPAEYLAIERKADFKSEYYRGEMFAMAGASRWHNRIAADILTLLNNQLDGQPCEPYMGDMRVRVDAADLYTYPDVVVACEPIQFEGEEFDVLLNPTLIVEVLSKSTESYDRGSKFEMYRSLASLREYLLVAQDHVHVEKFVRQADDSWLMTMHDDLDDVLELKSISCTLPLAKAYKRMKRE